MTASEPTDPIESATGIEPEETVESAPAAEGVGSAKSADAAKSVTAAKPDTALKSSATPESPTAAEPAAAAKSSAKARPAAASEAATIYLDPKRGDDAATGATPKTAVKTIDKALELAGKGGTIHLLGTVQVNKGENVTVSNVTVIGDPSLYLALFDVCNGTLTIENAIIDANGASLNNSVINVGGLGWPDGGTLNIKEGAMITGSDSGYAGSGGVRLVGSSVLNMTGGTIKGNTSQTGGGIAAWDESVLNLSGGSIEGNTASWGAGLVVEGSTAVNLTGTVVRDNAADYGAGMCILGGTINLFAGGIQNNTATYGNGAGIYMENATFNMTGGSITGNKVACDGDGGGIMAWAADYLQSETVLNISGGTIADNIAANGEEWERGDAIFLGGQEGGSSYGQLRLSGSPAISGEVYVDKYTVADAKISVTGAFAPENPMLVQKSGSLKDGQVLVSYAEGLAPSAEHFVYDNVHFGLQVQGQDLLFVGTKAVGVFAQKGDRKALKYIYVLPGERVDKAQLPGNVDLGKTAGYTATWKNKDAASAWGIDDPVTAAQSIYPEWSLDAPAIEVSASADSIHEGAPVTLTANATHPAGDGITYAYAWYRDGELLDGADESTLEVTEPGCYAVKVSADDAELVSAEAESAAVELKATSHAFSGWTVTVKPTATEDGAKTRTCQICSFRQTESIPATGAEPAEQVTVTFIDYFNRTEKTVKIGKGRMVGKPADPRYDGYTFAGWYSDKAAKHKFDFDAPVTGDLTLYAGYIKKGASGARKELPQTGDDSALPMLLTAGTGTAAVVAGIVISRRRKA